MIEHDDAKETIAQGVSSFEQGNLLLEHCLEIVLRQDDPRNGLNGLISYLGNISDCDRVSIFEVQNDLILNNTWEWCKSGIHSQKDILQKIKISEVKSWYDFFLQNKNVIIENVENLRVSEPVIYAYLKPQGINRLLAGRIFKNNEFSGFLCLLNPAPQLIPALDPVISQIGKIAGTQLRRIDIHRQLLDTELRDPETRLYTQKAMYRHASFDHSARTMGVIYGRMDRSLSNIGKNRLQTTCELLVEILETGRIYQLSPTEFLAVYVNVGEDRVNNLRRKIKFTGLAVKNEIHIGSAWTAERPVLDDLLQKSRRWSYLCGDENQKMPISMDPLFRYIERNYFDLGFFLKSLSAENESGYFYFGDIQNNVYYVSDNLARKFNLSGNLIQDLPQFWYNRITGDKARQRFEVELQSALDGKQNQLDVYHQVYTNEGHMEWVRCFVMIKWNVEGTLPAFCAGRLMMQDVSLLVDCNTNFSWETVLCRNLSKLRDEGEKVRIIGFSLNDIARVNNMQGRAFGDNLIRSVSESLSGILGDRLSFYKLSGMRCAAVIRSDYRESYSELIAQIKKIIEDKYHTYGIDIPNPSSFALLDFPKDNVGTLDFVEDLNNLIKLAQTEIAVSYVDGRKLDIRAIQQESNMALELGCDVINEMNHFRMVIQPVVSTKTGKVVAGEALLRWKCDGRNVSPGVFIPILEHEKLILPVGRWVLEQSIKICRRIVSFQQDFHLSINVSLQQLDDPGFVDFIGETLRKYNLSGKHIFLEITESCMDTEQEKLMHFVNYCETLGIKVALDDFGTGYSSIRVLMQYPTSIIKLDRSLLLEMGKSADKLNFISSIVFACHQFGKQVCIEGVETREQCEMVKKADCDLIQGFFYYQPLEVEEIYSILAQNGSLIQKN